MKRETKRERERVKGGREKERDIYGCRWWRRRGRARKRLSSRRVRDEKREMERVRGPRE